MRYVILISTTRKGNKMQVTLTEKEIEALLYALEIAEASFADAKLDGDLYPEDIQSLKAWNRIEAKLYK